jgi:hypothetical protein
MDYIVNARQTRDTAARALGEHILDVMAVNAREFGLSTLLMRFNQPGTDPTASAGPSVVQV